MWMRLVFLMVVSSILSVAPAHAQQDKTLTVRSIAEAPSFAKRALIIGVGDYEHANPLSPTTFNDAKRFADLLQTQFGFPAEAVTVLTDAPGTPDKLRPSYTHLRTAINTLLAGVNENSEVVFFFSGHGTRAADHDWLVPLDGEAGDVNGSCINYDEFKARLDTKRPQRALLIVDACRNLSGGKADGSSGFGASKSLAGRQFAELLSCQPKEISQVGKKEDFSESVFTHFLLQGLKGDAEAQNNGVVTFDSLKLFVQGKVSQYVSSKFGEAQNPDGRATLGAMVLARGLPKPDPRLKASNIAGGHVYRDARPESPVIGDVWINPKDGAEMVWVPGGTFTMGGTDFDDQKPPHTVRLTIGYWMYRTTVTVSQYEKFSQDTGRQMPPEPVYDNNHVNPGWKNKDHPIVNVSWNDAMAYCQWAGASLPTEAQWERAARGPQGLAFPWGNTFDSSMLWHSKSKLGGAHGTSAVGKFPANGFGLYDMAGNVWQWCLDCYDEKFYGSLLAEQPDPVNTAGNDQTPRVLRGGTWFTSNEYTFRCAFRGRIEPDHRSDGSGFRCVLR